MMRAAPTETSILWLEVDSLCTHALRTLLPDDEDAETVHDVLTVARAVLS